MMYELIKVVKDRIIQKKNVKNKRWMLCRFLDFYIQRKVKWELIRYENYQDEGSGNKVGAGVVLWFVSI